MTAKSPRGRPLAMTLGVLALAVLAGVGLASLRGPPSPVARAPVARPGPPAAGLAARGKASGRTPDASEAVRGIVVDDATGAPVAGAAVEVEGDWRRPSSARATTGGDGRFRLVTPDATPRISVRADGYAPRAGLDGEPGRETRLALVRAAVVKGRVTSAGDGRPVAGIDVRVAAGRSAPRVAATTDADGRYEVTGVGPGEIAVYAGGGGWIQEGIENVLSRGWNPFCLSVDPGGVAVADRTVVQGTRAIGHVTDPDGRPVEGAVLFAEAVPPTGDGVGPLGSLLGGASSDSSGPDGAFTVLGLVPGVAYAFHVRSGDLPALAVATRVAPSGSPLVLDVQLKPVGKIHVLVRERPTGRPVPGASVRWSTAGTWAREDPATTGEDGIAHLGPLFFGRYAIEAEAGGYVSTSYVATDVEVAAPTSTATVDLARASSIEGVVRLPDGSPAAGASVDCDTEDGGLEGQTASCDGEGRFLFEGLREGPHALRAEGAQGSGTLPQQQTVAAGRRDVVLTLTAKPAETPPTEPAPSPAGVVTVVDGSGKPVPRATLYVREPERNRYRHWSEVVDGSASIEDAEESGWILEVLHPTTAGGAPLSAGVGWGLWNVKSGPLEVRLPSEAPIAGTVVDDKGRPVQGVLLEAVPERVPEPDARHFAEEVVSRTRSGPGGAFLLRGTGPEAYRIAVSPPAGSAPPEPVVENGGATGVVVRMRAGVAPTITVLDADGHPVANAIVSATSGPHETYLEWPDSVVTELNEGGLARTSAEGTVRLQGLDPAAGYDLYVGRPRDRQDVLGLDTPDWRPADTTVRLPRALRVRGTVRDPAGQPVEGAEVTMSQEGTRPTSAWTDAAGAFRFDLVPAGRVDLEARLAGSEVDVGDAAGARARVDAGEDDVRLTLRTGADLRLRIEGLDREPLAQITREPLSDASVSHSASVHAGAVRFRGLTAGATYALWVEPDEHGRFVYATGLAAGAAETVVRADTGRRLGGTVTAPSGSGRIAVRASGPGWSLWTTAGADGRYAFPGLPSGPCRVEAEASRGEDDLSAARDAQTGDVVDLVLEKKR